MALQVYVNGVDRSSLILWRSLSWDPALTSEVDLLSFSVYKFGARTFGPEINDEVTFYDGGTKVFGGHVVQVKNRVEAYDRIVYDVIVKDYSHDMDRILINEQYDEVPAINVICEMLNEFINEGRRVQVASFQSNEIWSTATVDTTNFRTGTQALKLTSTGGSTATMQRSIFLDLTQNGATSSSDYHTIDVYVDDYTKVNTAVLRVITTASTDYYSVSIASQLTANGWNHVRVQKSAFTSTGTPSWSNINVLEIEIDATGTDNLNCTFANWQVLAATAFTYRNAVTASQTVEHITFNLETGSNALKRLAELFNWQWYVDQDRDIHFFPKFQENAAFDLSDTGGNYIYGSLEVVSSGDQLRNSIFVRGGDYLGAELTETLTEQADGSNLIFLLGYSYDLDSMTLTQAGTEVAVGTDNIDAYADNRGVYQSSTGLTTLSLGDAAARYYQSQQVICEKKGRRSKVKLRIKKVGTPADNFQVTIYADNGSNQPNLGSALSTTATLAGGSITTSFVEYTFTLTESATNSLLLSPDTKYHIVCSRSGAADAANYFQLDAYADVYDGKCYRGTSVPAWTHNGYDLYFIEVLAYEVLYNADEKILTFDTAPAAATAIEMTAQPLFPVLIQYRDNTSIDTYGEYQYKVVDATIKSKEAARQRALEEILQWGSEVKEFTYRTYSSGLKVGQTQNIQSTVRGIDEDVIITKISARARGPEAFEYFVTAVTTKTMGILYWLQQQIAQGDRELTIDDTELLDKIEAVTESFAFTDSAPTSTLYTGKVWSNDAGTTPDRLQWDGGATHIWV